MAARIRTAGSGDVQPIAGSQPVLKIFVKRPEVPLLFPSNDTQRWRRGFERRLTRYALMAPGADAVSERVRRGEGVGGIARRRTHQKTQARQGRRGPGARSSPAVLIWY